MIIIFLDDSTERAAITYQRWPEEKRNKTIWCATAEEAINVLREYAGQVEEAYLDHDLGGQTYVDSRSENCGMSVVRFIEKLPQEDLGKFKDTAFICHSWNISACLIMKSRLCKLGLNAIHIPFGQ